MKPQSPADPEGQTAAMKNILMVIVLAFATVIAPCFAQSPAAHAADFDAFYAKFRSAAKANDRQKIADLIAFPVADWSVERKGDVQSDTIRDRTDFLKRYDLLFTASMRAHLASAKPQPLKDGRYVVIWDDAGAEFSFEFAYTDATGFRVTSYSIGPL
ncbi:MAG TPA: hypothetical protein VK753_02315 [Xanthomonadaceae bacterium]|nr:hypothetical protein [Xanthomonadaceae bacterium]